MRATGDAPSSRIIVISRDCRATLKLLVKCGGLWREQLCTEDAWVGRNGVTQHKREGDGCTPSGLFSLGVPFGVEPAPEGVTPYLRLTGSEYWVDDPESRYYDRLVCLGAVEKDWSHGEHLIEKPVEYAYACPINHNPSHTPGDGSAIFLHCSGGGPTSGCVSVPRDIMTALLRWRREDTQILVI